MANKDNLLKGLQTLAMCFPLAIFGPSLYYWKGAQALKNDQPWWLILSAIIMLGAIYFFVKGLKKILNALFE